MKVVYDKNLKIAGIGVYPWARLGPQNWFDNYKIASLFDWDVDGIDGIEVHALQGYAGRNCHDGKQNTPSLLQNPLFQNMLREYFSGYAILTYKPVTPPEALADSGITFLSDETETVLSRRFENKAWFRRAFADKGIHIPDFTICKREELVPTEAVLAQLLAGRSAVVLQDSVLSGGKGTFIVRDITSFSRALSALSEAASASDEVVVSQYIPNAQERSVQGVVTRYGVFIGPMQQQIIADPSLVNNAVPGAELFCGTQISMQDSAWWAYDQQKKNALVIGKELQEAGYRGIFGVDSLVKDGAVYTLEVNARITGATPLLTMNYDPGRHIPFYLLHILELIGADYSIVDDSYDNTYEDCSLMIPHSLLVQEKILMQSIESGLYTNLFEFEKQAVVFDGKVGQPKVLVQSYAQTGKAVKAGGRILSAFMNYAIISSDGQITSEARQLVGRMLNRLGVNSQ